MSALRSCSVARVTSRAVGIVGRRLLPRSAAENLDETAKTAKREEEKMPEFMTPKMRETIGAKENTPPEVERGQHP